MSTSARNAPTIEVLGIGFPNKGAELMLATVLARLDQEFEDGYRLVLQSHHPYHLRQPYGAFQKYWTEKSFVERGLLTEFIPKGVLRPFGIVRDSEIDVVLDCSGFAYGDQWRAKKARRRLGRNVRRWRKQGRKIVLMPQAFGPFEDRALREEMKRVLSEVHLVFARDRTSFAALTELAPDSPVVRQSPDMTFGFLPHTEAGPARARRGIAVIPNEKMVGMGAVTREGYVEAFAALVGHLVSEGRDPFLLLHEGEKDRRICDAINDQLDAPVELVAPTSPVEIKRVIGECEFVLTSRFHGLVSAVSQGVPCAATSWSHKYEVLAEEFESPEIIVSTSDPDFVQQVVTMAMSDEGLASRRRTFERVAAEKRHAVEQMWQETLGVIGT